MRYFALGLLLLLAPLAAPAGQGGLDALIHALKQERQTERLHNQEREARFLAERESRQARLAEARTAKEKADQRAEGLRRQYEANGSRLLEMDEQLDQSGGELGQMFDSVRQVATDVRAQLDDSMITAQFPQRSAVLDTLSKGERLPSIGQLEAMWLLLLEEMNQSGRVVRFKAPVISSGGEESERPVLRVGPFTAVSQGSYLRFLPEAGRFVELSRQPPLRYLQLAAELEQAGEGVHPLAVDPSRGALLGLMVQSPDLRERLRQGGVVGYVILGLGALALLLVLERYLVLFGVGFKMKRRQRTGEVRGDDPMGRISLMAEQYRDLPLEALDMHLDEAVSREASRLSRGLSTLAVVAAAAPLLGLLGTVTGMIETFQAITLFGAGDPKMMSSGISQALITTQLGLVVAIPVLLLHSFLKGRANSLIEVLDRHGTTLLGQSSTLRAMNARLEQLLSFFELGGPVTWGILVFSLLLWTLILERYWFFVFTLPRERNRVEGIWLQARREPPRLAARERSSLVAGHGLQLRRYLLPIRTLTGALPLLGLLGTVSGMIDTFDVMTVFGNSNVRGMAGGISRALLTTMAGLLTALSGFYFSANLESRARAEERRMAHLLK